MTVHKENTANTITSTKTAHQRDYKKKEENYHFFFFTFLPVCCKEIK